MELGISAEDFSAWKHHPVSKVLLRYFADYRETLIKAHLDDWAAGKLDEVRDLEIRGRCLQLTDIVELSYESVRGFYHSPEQQGEDATEQRADT